MPEKWISVDEAVERARAAGLDVTEEDIREAIRRGEILSREVPMSMDQPTCATCPYCHIEWADQVEPEPPECRRFPPVLHPDQEKGDWQGNWPFTFLDGWCGEHPDFPAWIAAGAEEAER